MPTIAIPNIKISADRQREDVGAVEELAASIKEYGLLEPVLLDGDHNLVAGFRRLTAVVSLGWEEIKYESLGALDPIRAQEIELEENIRRKQLSWQEESKAIAKIHQMKMARDPSWTAEKTAAAVGTSRRTVFNQIELAKALDQHPEVAKADTVTGAMLRLNTIKSIDKRKEDAKARTLAVNLGLKREISVEARCGDAYDLLKRLPAESFDMAISNPPYGVDIESVFIGDREVYKDKHQDIVPLVAKVCAEVFRVLKDGRWFAFFYPTARLEEGKSILRECGFKFSERPCVWYKPNKYLGALSNPYQQLACQYETFFFAFKGDARFNKLRLGDVFVYETPDRGDRIHPLQMPPELWQEVLEIGSVEGESIIEPFSGSGSGGIAAIRTNRNYLGLELSEEFAARSNMWFNEELTGTVRPSQTADDDEPSLPISSADNALAINKLAALEG